MKELDASYVVFGVDILFCTDVLFVVYDELNCISTDFVLGVAAVFAVVVACCCGFIFFLPEAGLRIVEERDMEDDWRGVVYRCFDTDVIGGDA
jgi:hypothetical protein